MADASPIVGKESPVSEVPFFDSLKKSSKGNHISFSRYIASKKIYTTSRFAHQASCLNLKTLDAQSTLDSSYPQVYIADDDSFQHFYYVNFFQKSVDFEGLEINRDELKVHLLHSGDELIEKYQGLTEYARDKLALMIIDYNMGQDKLSGVETAIKLREAGYGGPLILRTSETKEYLTEKHENFEELLREKIIDVLLEKTDFKAVKEIVQSYLQLNIKGRDSKEQQE